MPSRGPPPRREPRARGARLGGGRRRLPDAGSRAQVRGSVQVHDRAGGPRGGG
ncbi:predicted protein [Streptomyces sp. SPB78]|nr:predicted protein [Streptomyces sp. SPB78]